jgi:hypothetical protein
VRVAKANLDVMVNRKCIFSVRTRNQYLQSVTTLLAELSHMFHFFFIIFTFGALLCFSSAYFVALDDRQQTLRQKYVEENDNGLIRFAIRENVRRD